MSANQEHWHWNIPKDWSQMRVVGTPMMRRAHPWIDRYKDYTLTRSEINRHGEVVLILEPPSLEEIGATWRRLRDGCDVLLKSEDEGAKTNEQQMKDALEIKATQDALMDAGYKPQLNGTFENTWFIARIDGVLEEGIVPPQRKVIYEKKKL